MNDNLSLNSKSINHVLEVGTPYPLFESYLNSYSEYIDIIKFGWGSALVDPDFSRKLCLCKQLNIVPVLGGTFFEYMIYHYNFAEFLRHIDLYGLDCIELSRGTIDIDDSIYCSYIKNLSSKFFVMSEVGRKTSNPELALSPQEWIQHCEISANSGASLIILESRESGLSGYVSDGGQVDSVLLELITARLPIDSFLFEAPIKSVQTYLINRFGPLVNLGNISLDDIVAVQSLRKGLRSDTLLTLSPGFQFDTQI